MDNPILETRSLTKIYGENVIFRDINLKVNEGETIVIIGPSGTGKSTLLRCINRSIDLFLQDFREAFDLHIKETPDYGSGCNTLIEPP